MFLTFSLHTVISADSNRIDFAIKGQGMIAIEQAFSYLQITSTNAPILFHIFSSVKFNSLSKYASRPTPSVTHGPSGSSLFKTLHSMHEIKLMNFNTRYEICYFLKCITVSITTFSLLIGLQRTFVSHNRRATHASVLQGRLWYYRHPITTFVHLLHTYDICTSSACPIDHLLLMAFFSVLTDSF